MHGFYIKRQEKNIKAGFLFRLAEELIIEYQES